MSLEIRNLSKKYGDKTLFSSFNLSLPDKGVFALFGESGIGKTTLLRIISGLDTDFSGVVTGGGLNNSSLAFQEYRLFPWLCALDNLIFAVADKRDASVTEKARGILSSLGFTEADMSKRPSELSGGMKQRVSIGRALMKDSPLLLLDEPTKELDEDNITLVLNLIRKEASKRLVIIVTHRKSDIDTLGAELIAL